MADRIQLTLSKLTDGLSPTQERALTKLMKSEEWDSAYGLRETISTLDSLVKRGLCIKKCKLGCIFFPRIDVLYKIRYRIVVTKDYKSNLSIIMTKNEQGGINGKNRSDIYK